MSENKSEKPKGIKRKLLLALITTILIVFMFPKGESIEFQVSEGSIWTHEDLIAPFSFAILKDPIIYNNEVKSAENSVYPVFKRIEIKITDTLSAFNKYLIEILNNNLEQETGSPINPTFLSASAFNTFLSVHKDYKASPNRRNSLSSYLELISGIVERQYSKGILNLESNSRVKDSIAIRIGNIDRIEPTKNYELFDKSKEKVNDAINRLEIKEELKPALTETANYFIRPNLIYDERATSVEIEQAKSSVSRYSGIINENERIVAKHDRITRQTKLKIESYKEAKGDEIEQHEILLQNFGKFLHIGALLSIFGVYLYLFRKKIFYDNNKIILISLIFLFVSFVTFLINFIDVKAPIHFLIFIPAASMIFTIMFDSRVGFYTTVILTLIAGALRGNDYTFMAMNFVAGGLSVYTVRDIKNRTQIFRSFLFILIGYLVSILAFGLERFASFETMLVESAFATSNALISPVLTYGLLVFFERIFKITTDLTLLELSNFDRPLLRDLARKAPGTFNHSMTMGTIAEAAAEKIGANSLLARVGAYYHDIGKTIYPQAFVENQLNSQNIHEELKPEESLQMILRHVDEGIELAKLNKLPQEIIDFIPMHHGTTAITFFLDKAKKMYGEENVKAEEYRYKGPRPNNKETAIVMLADGCESAVRSIAEPDPKKVENLISNIINSRIKDGQLDDSPITFADVSKIKESFLSILILQHHKRIKYPKQKEAEMGLSSEKEN